MKKYILIFLLAVSFLTSKADETFVAEPSLKDSLMQMLTTFSQYIEKDYLYIDDRYACFKGENTMGNDERGVRTNADLSMICAFLSRYGKCQQLDSMAMKTLRFAIDSHKAVEKTSCKENRYWGSVSRNDHQWESSLWAMSVAYSAFFQWNRLPDEMKADLHDLLVAECNYELERNIPTGYIGDTKAEENGWEVDVLAATLGLFPDDILAPKWFERMREFAINSYSHSSDAKNNRIIDAWYNRKTVADLYKGPNLYDDWTLQNHDFFHTSYQNVVIQELGEAKLALKLFQGKNEKWKSNALLHHCDSVTQNVLNWLTLPDGEQAMPNGNDWSLFLYDQITSYSTMACMMRDADALLFENQAFKQICRRQKTTDDGSWLLRPDVGARRMGVEAHRVMMSWLMHENFSTETMKPTKWENFYERHAQAKFFPCQSVIRTLTPHYFACFSWSKGKKSYTGYIEPLDLNNNNLVVPYRKYNTGNLIGFYQTKDIPTNGVPADMPTFRCIGPYFEVSGSLLENDSTLRRKFSLTSTRQGLVYQDTVQRLKPVEVVRDNTGLLAISTDEFTRKERKLDLKAGKTVVDGTLMIESNTRDKAFWGDLSTDNSIQTTKILPFYYTPVYHHKVTYRLK